MGLFKPAWMTDKPAKRAKAIASVQRTSDQAKLARIAREAPLGEVRAAAASRMSDQDTLLEVATTDWSPIARKEAIRHMDDSHLARFAGRNDLFEYNNKWSGAEEERMAVGLITSSDAMADLFLLLQMHQKTHPKAGGILGETVRERMGEAECASAIRKLRERGEAVEATSFLGSRVQSPELRRELGIGLDKAELAAMFRQDPRGDTARALWPMLDDSERRAMQQAAVSYLCAGRMEQTVRFDGLIAFIDSQEDYARLLMANPNHERNLTMLIDRVTDPEALRGFLAMLDERRVYTSPAITRPPEPAGGNFIIHTDGHNDHRAIERVTRAAERRLRALG